MNSDVLIVGGGLIGSATALYLAKRDVKSIVIDKDHPGRHASGVNAGGLRKLNRNPAEIPLTVEASQVWSNIRELVDEDCDVKLAGQARVAENVADLELLEQRAAMVRDLGFDHEQMIGRDRLYELIPALSPHCVGALWCEGDGYARPYHATTAFRRKAESLGVTYLTGTAVDALERDGENWLASTRAGELRAPLVVNAAGAWGAKLAAVVGDRIPLEPGAPTLMVTERLPHFIDPVVGAASRKLSFKQMQNGTVVIGGAHMARLDMTRERTEIDYRTMAESAVSADGRRTYRAHVGRYRGFHAGPHPGDRAGDQCAGTVSRLRFLGARLPVVARGRAHPQRADRGRSQQPADRCVPRRPFRAASRQRRLAGLLRCSRCHAPRQSQHKPPGL